LIFLDNETSVVSLSKFTSAQKLLENKLMLELPHIENDDNKRIRLKKEGFRHQNS
jgi:hypothetical protein